MIVWLAIAALLFVAPAVLAQDDTPSIEVEAQAVVDGTVTIDRVWSDGPGWLVIHADNNGQPGDVLGYEAVTDGENLDVVVDLDTDPVTGTLYAMLHTDLGTEGTFDFPGGADVPVEVDGEMVVEAFMVTAAQETATVEPTAQATAEATVQPTAQATAEATATVETQPETLPETGGNTTPWLPLVLLALGVAVVAGSALIMRTQAQTDKD